MLANIYLYKVVKKKEKNEKYKIHNKMIPQKNNSAIRKKPFK